MAHKELELQLLEGGNKLLKPPADVDELIHLLNQVERCLISVEQSPSQSMLDALEPSRMALITEELLKHAYMDVKVAVASCISEITRITAPDAPYDDDLMKEIFRVIVAAFEDLSDMHSRSYVKRVSILETVAKVRSCVVMLDLECDDLIFEMFQHFLKSIRNDHPENVFNSMLLIMTLVLEESEEISPEILGCLLRSVKKGDQDVPLIAQKLGAKVIDDCAVKIQPYLLQEVRSKRISLDDYNKVVAKICQETSDALERNGSTAPAQANENNASARADADKLTQATEKLVSGVAEGDPSAAKSPTSAVSTAQIEGGQATKSRRGRKSRSSPSADISDRSQADSEKETADVLERKDGDSSKDNDNMSLPESPATKKTASPSNPDRKMDVASPAKLDHETVHPSQSDASPRPKRGRPAKKKSSTNTEAAQSGSGRLREPKRSRLGDQDEEAVPASAKLKHKVSGGASDLDVKPDDSKASSEDTALDEVRPSTEISSKKESTVGKEESKIKRRRGRPAERDASSASHKRKMDSAIKFIKEPADGSSPLKESIKTALKRKWKTDKTAGVVLDETLVGSKIEVYWPDDAVFYQGVVDSYDPVKKKHRIVYNDGDEEILLLKNEEWRFIEGDKVGDKEQATNKPKYDGSSELLRKKKTKTTSESYSQARNEETPRRGVASRNKSSGDSAAKSGGKLKSGDSDKSGKKSKDGTSKTGPKHKDVLFKSKYEVSKNSHKMKDESPRSGSKIKDELLKAKKKLKGESSKISSKSDPNGDTSDKGKSVSRGRKSEDSKRKSGSSAKAAKGEEESAASKTDDTSKGKSNSENAQEIDGKSGKKRRKTQT